MHNPVVSAASCADDHDPGSLSVSEARRRILAAVEPIAFAERLALRAALGRVLADSLISPIDVPSHTNSAMDGYALAGTDLPPSGASAELTLAGEARAGHPLRDPVKAGQCIRIMTGAPMPAGTDTVVMQEQVENRAGRVRIGDGHRVGQNVRHAGEDIAAGTSVLEPGRVLTPADLGLLASLGIAEVSVYRRPRVAFFSTGDELRSIGEVLNEGDVYDSNRYTLFGMLQRLDVDILDLGVVPDAPRQLESALERAARDADVVLTSGGVSVGEADYIKDLLASLGRIAFWKIAMKPGRPLAFGQIGDALLFGLPGNPVAVMVTFYQFVQPALRYLMSGRTEPPLLVPAVATCSFRKRAGRTEFQRGVLQYGEDGRLQVSLAGRQGSGVLSSMSRADCFVVLPEESRAVEPGDWVQVQPFSGLV